MTMGAFAYLLMYMNQGRIFRTSKETRKGKNKQRPHRITKTARGSPLKMTVEVSQTNYGNFKAGRGCICFEATGHRQRALA